MMLLDDDGARVVGIRQHGMSIKTCMNCVIGWDIGIARRGQMGGQGAACHDEVDKVVGGSKYWMEFMCEGVGG